MVGFLRYIGAPMKTKVLFILALFTIISSLAWSSEERSFSKHFLCERPLQAKGRYELSSEALERFESFIKEKKTEVKIDQVYAGIQEQKNRLQLFIRELSDSDLLAFTESFMRFRNSDPEYPYLPGMTPDKTIHDIHIFLSNKKYVKNVYGNTYSVILLLPHMDPSKGNLSSSYLDHLNEMYKNSVDNLFAALVIEEVLERLAEGRSLHHYLDPVNEKKPAEIPSFLRDLLGDDFSE